MTQVKRIYKKPQYEWLGQIGCRTVRVCHRTPRGIVKLRKNISVSLCCGLCRAPTRWVVTENKASCFVLQLLAFLQAKLFQTCPDEECVGGTPCDKGKCLVRSQHLRTTYKMRYSSWKRQKSVLPKTTGASSKLSHERSFVTMFNIMECVQIKAMFVFDVGRCLERWVSARKLKLGT